jgi:copper chaperone CopZ
MKKSLLVLFIAALVFGWSVDISAVDKKADAKAKTAKIEQKAEETITLKKVTLLGPGIDCNLCAETIKQAFAETKGVKCVHVDVKSKLATFCFTPEETRWKKIRSDLGEAGYESEFVKVADAECPCDDRDESCKHLAMAEAKDTESCKKKGCPFADQCKKVCK